MAGYSCLIQGNFYVTRQEDLYVNSTFSMQRIGAVFSSVLQIGLLELYQLKVKGVKNGSSKRWRYCKNPLHG